MDWGEAIKLINKMGTTLNIIDLREYLIDLYERFLNGEDIKEEAKKTFMDYIGAREFISSNMTNALSYLEDIGWEIPADLSHIKKPIKELALDIIKTLKKEAKNPPKEWFRKVYKSAN